MNFSKKLDIDKSIFSSVAQRTPGAENLKILHVQPKFLKGSLYTVGFDVIGKDGEQSNYVNRVYVHGRDIDVYGFDDQLLAIVGATHSDSFIEKLMTPDFVSTFIAISMTLIVAFSFISNIAWGKGIEIPEFISSGWLLILGFYFGKSTSQRGVE